MVTDNGLKADRNPLQPLEDLLLLRLQPYCRVVWLGLGFLPEKKNAILIDPLRLPTEHECRAVYGLDVIVLYEGFSTSFGVLRRLCDVLYQGMPRRLQAHDLDYGKAAYLRLGART